MGKNVDVLSLSRNSRLCSRQFRKEQINIDCETSGDAVYFNWNKETNENFRVLAFDYQLPNVQSTKDQKLPVTLPSSL